MIEITRILDKASEEVCRQCGIRQDIQVDPLCSVQCVVEILEMRDRATFRDEIALDHALTMNFEDAAFGKSSTQGLTNLGRIRASALSQHKRLGNSTDGHTDDDLVCQFRKLPCPVRPHMNGPAHDLEDRLDPTENLGLATGHDSQRS